jgi:sugar/nucleoside kinase (ribokinase family)
VTPLAVVGNLARDEIAGDSPRAGGGPYHCARALRLLSERATIVACSGDPSLFGPLITLGVPVTRVAGKATSSFAFHYEGDVRVMTVTGLGDTWEPETAGLLAPAGWVHVAPLARSDFPPETLAAYARKGRRISLDGQGLVRPPHTGPLELDADYDPELLRHVSILKLAEEEAAVLGDLSALSVPEIVVTYGTRGCDVYFGGTVEHVRAHGLDVDPTGAGDMFSAAYMAARAARQAPVAAARRASRVVAEVLAGL